MLEVAPPRIQSSPGLNHSEALSFVATEISSILGDVDISDEAVLMDAGIDSLAAVELTSRLKKALRMPLPSFVVFDYPTKSAIASYIAASVPERRGV
jgi:acyl carrier protein